MFFPFLPGDSLLFAAGVFSADGGGLNVWATLIVFWAAATFGQHLELLDRAPVRQPHHRFRGR